MKSETLENYAVIFATDIATIGLLFDGLKLVKVDYLTDQPAKKPTFKVAETVMNRIENYLEPGAKIKKIDVDVELHVTAFQQSVLKQLMLIPYGETRTYGDIAGILKTSPRAVGNACRSNPLPIVIPCHRVVSAKGIGGYAGVTRGPIMDIKRQLLQLEGVVQV